MGAFGFQLIIRIESNEINTFNNSGYRFKQLNC